MVYILAGPCRHALIPGVHRQLVFLRKINLKSLEVDCYCGAKVCIGPILPPAV